MIAVILAAGKSTRMKSSTPKVLHMVADKPMLSYSIDMVKKLNPSKIILVVSSSSEKIKEAYKDSKVIFCEQKEQNGTAGAVLAAEKEIKDANESVLILCGDMPNVKYETVEEFIKNCKSDKVNFISVKVSDPSGYGRVVRDTNREVLGIVEDKDADDHIKKINEINTGIYCCKSDVLLEKLSKVDNNNSQHEYYLTDIAANSYAWLAKDEKEFSGVNDRAQLAKAAKQIWFERAEKLMKAGVSIIEPSLTYIGPDVEIEQDVTIYPNVYITGKSKICKNSSIYAGVRIEDSFIGENCTIKDNTMIEQSIVGNNCSIGPMAHMRPNSKLCGDNHVGNFVELKKGEMGRGSKAGHLTYLGDCVLGENVNVGCGTITCNYDGYNKHQTKIGDNVFIGSDTQLVAPVNVGNGVLIAAGTTVVKDVSDDAMVISRVKQTNMEGKAKAYFERKKKEKTEKAKK